MPDRAVFLDRDGTINEEVNYLGSVDQLRFIKGAEAAIARLNEAALKVIVITNQAGVARGYFPKDAVEQIHSKMEERLKARGAHVHAFYYCPHHPSEGLGPYRVECDCRKPKPGLLHKAAREFDIDLSRSFVVGDNVNDLLAGYAAGCRLVLVRTGYGRETERRLAGTPIRPDYIANDLLEASSWILQQTTCGS